MTICCESCTSPLSAQCGSPTSSHPRAMETRQTSCKRFRSTKGASKARRDQINVEIRSMRALLPLPQEEVDRLSYLHSMSLICAFLRKTLLLQGLSAGQGRECGLPCEAFLNALPGFILVLSADSRLLYVSENVSDYLGYSMVDVLQGDSFYDMVEHSDLKAVKSHLQMDPTSSTERSFMCRMHTSKSFRLQHGSCSLLVRGRYHALPPSSQPGCPDQRVFTALCTPTADRQGSSAASRSQNCFTSSHRPDMTFIQLSDSVLFHLGCSAEEMIGRSWYSLLHPDDLSLGASSHKNLMQAEEGSQVEMVLRLQSRELSWNWLYICATRDTGGQGMSCTNYTVSETEAAYLRQKIHSDTYCPSSTPQLSLGQGNCPGRGSKRQRGPSCEDLQPRAKAARSWDPDVYYMTCSSSDSVSHSSTSDTHALFCTPPYSPISSRSPPQQEDTSSDFLLDVYSYTEQLLPSPDSSPPYHPLPDPHPAHLPLPLGLEQAYDQGVYSLAGPHSPESCPSPSCDYPDCTADAHLVPDCLSVSDSENCADCALHPEDPPLPVQPPGGASSFPAQHVPQALTPDLSPTSTSSCQYSEREQEEISILAQQISSLASSFDRYHTLAGPPSQPPSAPTLPSACDWVQHPPPILPPLKPQLVLDEGVFDSILNDLDMVPEKEVMPPCFSHQAGPRCGLEVSQSRPLDVGSLQQTPGLSLSSLVESLDQFSPAFSPLDTLALPAPCHHQHSELHQLNHYLHTSLQQGNQDGLVEESMY